MIFRSPHPNIPIPDIPFQEFILSRAEERKNLPVLIDQEADCTLNYGELLQDVRRVACGLAARGMRKGDVFALMLPNVPEFAIVFFGVLAAGGVVTTVNPLCTIEEITYQLQDSGAKYLLTIPQCLQHATAAASNTEGAPEVFVLGDSAGASAFFDLLASDGPAPNIKIDPKADLAVIPYSSGTVGKPKGVALTHANLSANVLGCATAFPMVTQCGIFLGLLPFFHAAGMVCVLHLALYASGTLVLMRRFELERMLQIIQTYRIEVASLVPPIVLALAKHPRVTNYDFSNLKLVTSGAAPLGADVQRACQDRLGTRWFKVME